MAELHLVRVFIGPGGSGGNPLAVFMDGLTIPPELRLGVTADLGYSETVYVDDPAAGRISIYVPTSELPFAGHPAVGTAWLLTELGFEPSRLQVPAGEVATWREADVTWIRARPAWVDFRVTPNFVEFPTSAAVDALPDHADEPWLYAWAWQDEAAGRIRARSFPTWAGISEDEASGAAAVLVGARVGKPLTISQGFGSEISVRPGPGTTVEVGGRCAMIEVREYDASALASRPGIS